MNPDDKAPPILKATYAIMETIRELGSTPSGYIYARVCGSMSLDTYNQIIGILKKADLVKEEAFVLSWVGPKDATPQGAQG